MKPQKTPVQRCRAEVGGVYKFLRSIDTFPKGTRVVRVRMAADRLERVCIALRDHLAFLEKQEEPPLEGRPGA